MPRYSLDFGAWPNCLRKGSRRVAGFIHATRLAAFRRKLGCEAISIRWQSAATKMKCRLSSRSSYCERRNEHGAREYGSGACTDRYGCRRGARHHRRCRRARRPALPRVLRRHHPQQEHAHGLLPGRGRFFAWCEQHQIGELADIEPMHVAAYIEALASDFAKPTVKQHLAAIRMLFDWLVIGQVVAINPAHAVRGPKHVVKSGKTPVLTRDEARALLDSIDTSTLVGLRDRALIARDDLHLRPRQRRRRHEGRGLLPRRASAGGSACTRKAASATRCRPTTSSRPISTPTSTPPASASRQEPPLPLRRRPHRHR